MGIIITKWTTGVSVASSLRSYHSFLCSLEIMS
jgi:serine/threonine protein kinase